MYQTGLEVKKKKKRLLRVEVERRIVQKQGYQTLKGPALSPHSGQILVLVGTRLHIDWGKAESHRP
jgi:hypothetical protein